MMIIIVFEITFIFYNYYFCPLVAMKEKGTEFIQKKLN